MVRGGKRFVPGCGQRRLTVRRGRCHIAPVNPDKRLVSRRHVDLCRQASAVCAVCR
ncbi:MULTISPECIES: putative leader peptide [unclassified Streptomyces]|uniref:putative leader peptide n=1 Tax=unclassified Streptomyces TaxID=2593676 RepID=UPI003869CD6C